MLLLRHVTPGVLLAVLSLNAGPCPLHALDCNGNGVEDREDVELGGSFDCNANGQPDECDVVAVTFRRVEGSLRVARIPRAIAAADVDGDGDLDLLTGNQNTNRSSTLSVLLGDGAGAFAGSIDFPAGERLSAFVVRDIDGDGNLDVASANVSDVVVFRGADAGTFGEPVAFSVDDSSARALTVADLDGDAVFDLVTANLDTNSLSILRGEGGGVFGAATKVPVGDQPSAVDAADFDGDGAVDLAVANRGSGTVSVLRGVGDGTFAGGAEDYDSGLARLFTVLARDFDGDGVPDLATANTDRAAVLLGDGAGRFEAPVVLKLPDAASSANSLVGVDIDGDGDLDLVAGFRSREQVVLLRNHGTRPFAARVETASQGIIPSSTALAAGDIDGNGEADLAFLVQSTVALVLRGEGGKRVVPFASSGFTQNATVHSLGIGDLDGDADLDVVTGNNSTSDGLVAYYGDGLGGYSEPRGFNTPRGNPFWIAVGDVDGDGDPDVAAALAPAPGVDCEQCVALVVRNDGRGDLSDGIGYSVAGAPRHILIVDLDGDDRPEVITAMPGRGTINLLPNNGDGTFAERREIRAGSSPFSTAAADVDGDGRVDLLTSNIGSGDLSLLRQESDGTFTERARYPVTGGPRYVVAVDLDGDGRVDLAAANERESTVSVLWNGGGGEAPRFEGPFDFPVDGRPHSVITTDLDGDGDEDLVTAHELDHTLSILFNNGARSFELSVPYPVGLGPRLAVAGDVDGDGDMDLVSGDHGTKGITVLLNQTPPAPEYLGRLCTEADFLNVTFAGSATSGRERVGKYVAPAREDESLLPVVFQNANRHLLQEDFLRAVFPERFGALTAEDYAALTARRATRDYYVGSLGSARVETGVIYTFTATVPPEVGPDGGLPGGMADPAEVLNLKEVSALHARLTGVFTLGPLYYEPDTELAKREAESWVDAPFEIFVSDAGTDPEPPQGTPTFLLEVPQGTMLCGVFPEATPGRTPGREYETKSQVRLVSGEHELLTSEDSFTATLIEELLYGPAQEVTVPEGAGTFQVIRIPAGGGETLYRFNYTQRFALSTGEVLEVRIFRLNLRSTGEQAIRERLVVDDAYVTSDLSMEGVIGGTPTVSYSSCAYELLPRWEIEVELEGGDRIELVERFAPTVDEASTGPAALLDAEVTVGGATQRVSDYWRLVYAAKRHNREVKYWILLDPVMAVAGLEKPLAVIELSAPEPIRDVASAARYLSVDFEVLAEPVVNTFVKQERAATVQPRFRRGDMNADDGVNVADAIGLLEYVFQKGAIPSCVKAADANDDGRVNLVDAIDILSTLFQRGDSIREPRDCGIDPTEDLLRCETHAACR